MLGSFVAPVSQAQAEFRASPEQVLAANGLTSVSAADIHETLPLVTDNRFVELASSHAVSPSVVPTAGDSGIHAATTPARRTHDYVRNGTTSLFAAFDLASGSVIAQPYRRHRHQEFLKFLKLIDKAVPKDLDLHLVLDNYATHKTPVIKEWLLKHPRFCLHFTPTSSSWLNLVERWFAELTNRKLRRSAHRSVTELETDIRKWITEWNKDPKPFIWTKSADEILETLAAYCERITDSGH